MKDFGNASEAHRKGIGPDVGPAPECTTGPPYCCAIAAEETRKKNCDKNFDDSLATCRFGTLEMLSVSVNSLVTVENTRE